MKKQTQWQWFAWGKHPGMEDFVWAGTQTKLFKRFTKWVDNGFARLNAGSRLRARHCSWRFWTKGTGQQVVCGLVRNSSDVHGRHFPLLYVGAGDLEFWAGNCSMLPFAFESVWKNFEYVASARFDTIRQLNDSLQLIPQPLPDWRTFQQRIYDTADLANTATCEESADGRKRLLKIDCRQPEHLPHDWQFCRHVMSVGDNQAPLAVFIGEIEDRVAVAIIDDTLTPADFAWLWALDSKNDQPVQPIAPERMTWHLI
jgi:type VI secretion system ImpM family protein